MFTETELFHITITSPDIDPRTVMDKFLMEVEGRVDRFVPVVSVDEAESERKKTILENQERLVKYPEKRDIFLESIKKYESMSTEDFVRDWYGYSDFDANTKFYGYVGHPDARVDSYELGEEIIFAKDGKMVNQAKMKDIDWEKMKQRAHEVAVREAEENKGLSGADRDSFISIREKVHLRPSSFVDKSGNWHEEDGEDKDVNKSLVLYAEAWEKALSETNPEDVITHWYISD